jgi:ribosomal 30S subunit maturation factor RimM
VVRGGYGEVLIPAVDDVVLAVDLDARVVTVEIVPGLLP